MTTQQPTRSFKIEFREKEHWIIEYPANIKYAGPFETKSAALAFKFEYIHIVKKSHL